jgi:hypothetical protein
MPFSPASGARVLAVKTPAAAGLCAGAQLKGTPTRCFVGPACFNALNSPER